MNSTLSQRQLLHVLEPALTQLMVGVTYYYYYVFSLLSCVFPCKLICNVLLHVDVTDGLSS